MVEAAITNKLSNAAGEQLNVQIRLITRRALTVGRHRPRAPRGREAALRARRAFSRQAGHADR